MLKQRIGYNSIIMGNHTVVITCLDMKAPKLMSILVQPKGF